MPTTPPDTHDPTYHTLLSTIAHQTGDPQPVLVDATALWTTAVAHGSLAHTDAAAAMQAAREVDHVLRWRDGNGDLRYGLTGDGVAVTPHVKTPLYDAADADALQAVIETEASREDPDQDVIGWCNRRLAAIEEGSDA